MNTVMWDVSINMPEEKDMLFSSQGHCILMRHMVGRVKSRLSVHFPEEVARDLRLLCWLISQKSTGFDRKFEAGAFLIFNQELWSIYLIVTV